MRKEKGSDMFVTVLFGICGLVILVTVWTQPMQLPERALTLAIGSLGFFGALFRLLASRFFHVKGSPVPVNEESPHHESR